MERSSKQCLECGFKCCQNSGCNLFISDLESPKARYIEQLLDEGYVSIIADVLEKKRDDGQIVPYAFLKLRARNVGKEAIDLLSIPTKCISLEKDGCHYPMEMPPGEGRGLVPTSFGCMWTFDARKETQKWEKYQSVLRYIVKKRTGLSPEEQLAMDAEGYMFAFLSGEVSKSANLYFHIANFVSYLKTLYEQEYDNAYKKTQNIQKLTRSKGNL